MKCSGLNIGPIGWTASYPIFDTRISVCPLLFVHHAHSTPLDSKTGWTGELWSKTYLLSVMPFFFSNNL